MFEYLESTPEETPPHAAGNNNNDDRILFNARKLLIFGEINDKQASAVCRRLLALSTESDAPITIFVSSPGGHVESGDAIHDMIRFVRAPVTVVGTGWVGSAAAHIFLAAAKERRICLPNTRFLIHQPAGGAGGQASDIAIQAEQIIQMRERIARVIADQTGQPVERVSRDIERDYWMDTDQALEYGIVSRVIAHEADLL
ncbi:ATP-dependent Clp protease proteolytic subunit [Acidihalobacter ferrooxydans]|uniref:ATP-dependent Clp protease proteolytic subunit n=1 Tax=Acidihalobacter ferrooxydans TaxID=1765967 RepID=A0A1P8UKJ6_9GAMM|nr:ATP-dependent Clp protease proteolytic subunit [Acidihalobacter ferrooxydans]APZ44367.1 ATP-dependent Clp protease proteolytic subunit [Acidihalobacter ferrooxydans]